MIDKLSGTQTARQREAAFAEWATEFEDQIKDETKAEIVAKRVVSLTTNRSKCLLNRKSLVKELGFKDTQPFTKNEIIEERLLGLESKLRPKYLVYAPEKDKEGGDADTSESKSKDLPKGAITASEAAKLHQRILELESENEALKGSVGRFSEVAEVYRRLGEMK